MKHLIRRHADHARNYAAAALVFVSAGAVGIASVVGSQAAPNNAPKTNPNTQSGTNGVSDTPTAPGQILDLSNWKLTLPTASNKGTAAEITQPKLSSYAVNPWFLLNSEKNGVIFRANHGGATTSGSNNPRSELREMTRNGTTPASWSSAGGAHTMTITQRINRLPGVKPQVVVGQIHDAKDDVTTFRLEGTKLWITDGDNANAFLVNANYRLGETFSVKFEVRGNVINYSYNDQKLNYTQRKTFNGAYFKAGNYLQSNPKTAPNENGAAFAEVVISDLKVNHE